MAKTKILPHEIYNRLGRAYMNRMRVIMSYVFAEQIAIAMSKHDYKQAASICEEKEIFDQWFDVEQDNLL